MKENQELTEFINEIRYKFPDVSRQMDERVVNQGFDLIDHPYFVMLEAFSQATTDAIRSHNEQLAKSYLEYMSTKLKKASKEEEEYIDGYYVESLMWNIKDKKILKWGWGLIPENLKELYRDTWDEPDF